MYQRGFAHILMIIIGLIFVAILIGVFTASQRAEAPTAQTQQN